MGKMLFYMDRIARGLRSPCRSLYLSDDIWNEMGIIRHRQFQFGQLTEVLDAVGHDPPLGESIEDILYLNVRLTSGR